MPVFFTSLMTIVLAVAGYAAPLFAKEKPWFVYKHEKFGYTIQYPSGWETRIIPGHPDWRWAGDYEKQSKDLRVPLSIIIAVDPAPSGTPRDTLTDYAVRTREEILISVAGAGIRKTLEGMDEWSKMDGVRVVGWGAQQEKVRAYGASFIKDELAYTVVYLSDDEKIRLLDSTIKSHLQRSLRSFKFPQPKPIVEKRKYESKSLGAGINYPSTWEVSEFLPRSVVFTDPSMDAEAGFRANASLALYVIPQAASMQSIIASFTKQIQQDKGIYNFKVVSEPRFIAFQKYTAKEKKVAEMTATFRLSDREGTPLVRSRFVFLALPDRSVVMHDRSLDSSYARRKAEFDTIMRSLIILPKK